MSARLSRLKSWLRAITHRDRLESQIEEEVLFHLEARAADLTQQGLSPREAIRRARIEFGAIPAHKDAMRHSLNLRWWDDLWDDLHYAARILRKSPGFTAIAVTSLALAIGANTTIFSYANRMLFVRLGVPHAEQLRMFRLTGNDPRAIQSLYAGDDQDSYGGSDGQMHVGVFPYPAYLQLLKNNHSVEDIFAFQQLSNIPIASTGSPQVAKVELVSGNFYTQIQVKPQLGRPIEPADDVISGARAVAVISDSFWHSNYGGSPAVLGKTIRVNSTPMTIVGVNPPAFTGPDGAETTAPQVFLPFSMTSALFPPSGTAAGMLLSPQQFWIHLMARARPDVSIFQAEAALNVAFNAALRGTVGIDKDVIIPRLSLVDGSRGSTMAMRTLMQPLYVLVGFAVLLLLLACANIANLMLARASFRQREMSARMALGATRGRILRQVITESLLLSVMGGVAGLFLGYISRNLIPWLMRTGWDGGEMPVGFDWRVFGFASAVTLLTGIFFGLAPAWRSTHSEISAALKEGARTATRKRKAWPGKAIVGFQVALSTLLVMSAGFFLRTLVNLNSVNPGFHTQNLLLFDISAPETRYPDRKGADLHRRTEGALAAVPGVQSVSVINMPLLAGDQWNSMFQIQGLQGSKPTDSNSQTMTSSVGPQFFSVMSIPILAGRGFTAEDTATSIPVSVVNQELVREFFPGTNPIGKRFRRALSGPNATRWIEIVGVCADTRYSDMREPATPIHFDLDLQSLGAANTVSYIVRSPLKPDTLLPSLRRAVQQIDPDLPINNIRTQKQQIAASMQQERMFASFTTGFGILALALACVGIYGIMAYTVSQRTNEIGIRLALGAHRAQVRAMVLRQATRLAILGVIIGVAASLALTRLIKSMLYGLQPTDPISIACAATLLLAVALIASWLPAFRASKVEPMEALRHE